MAGYPDSSRLSVRGLQSANRRVAGYPVTGFAVPRPLVISCSQTDPLPGVSLRLGKRGPPEERLGGKCRPMGETWGEWLPKTDILKIGKLEARR